MKVTFDLIWKIPFLHRHAASDVKMASGSSVETAVTAVTPDYKEYIALLTQEAPNPTITSGSLTVGRRYLIVSNTTGNFTNLAPNSNPGTDFIAKTTAEPISWGDGVLQSFGEPVAVAVGKNTLGVSIPYTYNTTGDFYLNLGNTILPDLDKIFVFPGNNYGEGYTIAAFADTGIGNRIHINTFNNSDALANGILYRTPIHIIVFD